MSYHFFSKLEGDIEAAVLSDSERPPRIRPFPSMLATRMKAQIVLRKIHHWMAPIILVPLGIAITAGLLLMVKKDFDWIQPPTQRGEVTNQTPTMSFEELFDIAQSASQLELTDWSDLARVDVKPSKGLVKFISKNDWEAQVDTQSGALLQVAYRRSDWIESLHDGSYFADWVKRYVFLPAGVGLLVLWMSGLYLFVITRLARGRKTRRAQAKLERASQQTAQTT